MWSLPTTSKDIPTGDLTCLAEQYRFYEKMLSAGSFQCRARKMNALTSNKEVYVEHQAIESRMLEFTPMSSPTLTTDETLMKPTRHDSVVSERTGGLLMAAEMPGRGSSASCGFLLLPAELRNAIYEYIYPVSEAEDVDLLTATPPPDAILSTCRQVYEEAISIYREACHHYWSRNRFRLTIDYKAGLLHVPASERSMRPVYECSAMFIQSIESVALRHWDRICHLEAVQIRPRAVVRTRRVSDAGLWERHTEIATSYSVEQSTSVIRLRRDGDKPGGIALQVFLDQQAADASVSRAPCPSVKEQLMYLAGW
jgi:hypothetical protein